MAVVRRGPLEALVGDPDDHRPDSRWRLVTDPADGPSAVADLSIIIEEIAPGDRVPLHIHHDVNECIMVIEGRNEVTEGDDRHVLGPGDVAFIAAGTPHAQRNVADVPLVIHAVFPSTLIDIDMIERNPAPGTEDRAPAHTVYDMRTGRFWTRD